MRFTRSLVIVLAASCTSWTVAPSAHATPAAGTAEPSRTQLAQASQAAPRREVAARERIGPEEFERRLAAASAQLGSAELASLQQALTTLHELGGRDAAIAIMERLRRGLPPQLMEQAVDALGTLNQPITAPVLVELTLHRRWQIREKAAAALGSLKMRSAVTVLLYSLDDPSAEVRSAAARARGLWGDARALPALITAVERGVDGALLALAQLGNGKHVNVILEHAKKNVKASEPALRTLLARTNLPVASKVLVVKAIRALANAEAEEVLAGWRSSFGKGTSPELLAALAPKGGKS
jgi:HEAT repeat protein